MRAREQLVSRAAKSSREGVEDGQTPLDSLSSIPWRNTESSLSDSELHCSFRHNFRQKERESIDIIMAETTFRTQPIRIQLSNKRRGEGGAYAFVAVVPGLLEGVSSSLRLK
jgi:hypothetical protein